MYLPHLVKIGSESFIFLSTYAATLLFSEFVTLSMTQI